MKKKGVALLITLMVIVVLSEIIYLSFSYIDKAKKDALNMENLVQINIIANDMVKVMEKVLANINDADSLDMLYIAPLTLELEEQNVLVTIEILPNSAVININNLGNKNSAIASLYEEVWLRILENHEVKDPYLLTKLVVDRIKKKDKEEKLLSEDGNFTARVQFDEILKKYYKNSEDRTVFNIDWEDFIGFDNEKIDFNFMTPYLLASLDEMIDLQTAKNILDGEKFYKKLEDINLENDIIQRLKKFPFSFFQPSFLCNCVYMKDDSEMKFSFDFDKEKGVHNFEILEKL